MKRLPVIAMCLLAPTLALADPPPAPPPTEAAPAFAVPVETLQVTGGAAKFMEMGQAAGGYSLLYRGGPGMGVRIGTDSRSSYRNLYRFTDATGAELVTGVCRIRTESRSAFGVTWNEQTAQLYACDAKDKPTDRYGIEVALPAFKQARMSLGMLSIEASEDIPDAAMQAVLKVRMVYDGVAYEAVPTEFLSRLRGHEQRVVLGYLIKRDGALVGRVDFGRVAQNRGTITAPTAEADGRQPVLFLAHQLSAMPDMYSPSVREQVFQRQ